MSSSRVTKYPRSSTSRRHIAVAKIEKLGRQLFEMGRCTPCQNSDSFCWVLEGRSKCSSCLKKGVGNCDGNFSEAEFDALERKKQEIKEKAAEQRAEIGRLAAEAASAYAAVAAATAALAKAQQEESRLELQAGKYAEAQSRMLRQELDALEALEEASPTGPPVAVLSDVDFLWDDSAVMEFLRDDGNNFPPASGGSDSVACHL